MGQDQCLEFNGVDTRLELGTLKELGLSEKSFTIEVWCRAGRAFQGTFLGLQINENPATILKLDAGYGELKVTASLPGAGSKLVQHYLTQAWLHVALSYSYETGEIRTLFNGYDAHPSGSVGKLVNASLYFGRGSGGASFLGSICDVRIWSYLRRDEEISGDMYQRLSGFESNLACYLPLDGGNGDSATEARDARIARNTNGEPTGVSFRPKTIYRGAYGNPKFVPVQRHPPAPGGVVVGEFDGISSFATAPLTNSIPLTNSLVVAAWIRPTSTGGPVDSFPVVSRLSEQGGWELRAGGGHASFVAVTGGQQSELTVPLASGSWYYVMAIYSNDGPRVFFRVNGIGIQSLKLSGPLVDSGTSLDVGRNSAYPGRFFKGQLGEVQIWTGGLSWNDYVQFQWQRAVPAAIFASCSLEGKAKDASKNALAWRTNNVRWVLSALPLPDSPEATVAIVTSNDSATLMVARDKLQRLLDATNNDRVKLQTELDTGKAKLQPLLGAPTAGKPLETLADELKNKLDALSKEKAQLQTNLTNATNEKANLQASLATATNEKANLQASLTAASTEKTQLQTNLNTATNEKAQLQAQIDALNAERATLQSSVTTLTQQRDEHKSISESKDLNVAQKEVQIKKLESDISQMTAKLTETAEEIEDLRAELADLQQKEDLITDLQDKIQTLESDRAQTSLEDFVKNANKEIIRARQVLAEGGNKYALGRVALEVKMLPGPSGVGMKFPTMEEMRELGATQLSTLNVDFEAQEGAEGKASEIVVPTVLGYTEVLARRKLAEAGLLVDTSYQAVKEVPGRTIEADRVVNQIPKAGDKVPPGSYVTIFIGRKS